MNRQIEKVKEMIIKNKKKLIIGVFSTVVVLGCAGVGGSVFVYNIAKSNINYNQSQAEKIALEVVKGEVVKVNKKLELEDFCFEYDVKIKDEKNMLLTVTVNADLGVITEIDNWLD